MNSLTDCKWTKAAMWGASPVGPWQVSLSPCPTGSTDLVEHRKARPRCSHMAMSCREGPARGCPVFVTAGTARGGHRNTTGTLEKRMERGLFAFRLAKQNFLDVHFYASSGPAADAVACPRELLVLWSDIWRDKSCSRTCLGLFSCWDCCLQGIKNPIPSGSLLRRSWGSI